MPDENDIDDEPDEDQSPGIRAQRLKIKDLEAQNVALREAAKGQAELERRAVFAEAGIIGDHPMRELLLKGYDGELTSEAVKAYATKVGFPLNGGASPAQQQQQQQRVADIDTNIEIDDAVGGGDGGGEEFAVYQRELEECNGDHAKITKVMQKYAHRVKLLSDID